jgi:hypothetical protein
MASTSRGRGAGRARSAIVCGIISFAILQLGLFASMSTRRLEILRDPDWGLRLGRLETRLSERPENPLVLILGSSRAGLGLRPDQMMSAWEPRAPVVFNFCRRGFGPMVSLLYLRRILEEGIRPDWIIFELWPPFLNDNNIFGRDDGTLDVRRLQWRDRFLVERDAKDGSALMHLWLKVQLTPWYWHRSVLLGYFAPKWGPPVPFGDDFWAATDEWGWRAVPEFGHDRFDRFVKKGDEFKGVLGSLHPTPAAERRITDFLTICRNNHIPVSVLYMPESSPLRSWYPQDIRRSIDEYLHRLDRDFGAPLIDARDWMPDEYFGDTHHLTAEGAALFSRHLAEVLGVPVKGQPLVARADPSEGRIRGGIRDERERPLRPPTAASDAQSSRSDVGG